jgi:hypothetical protein
MADYSLALNVKPLQLEDPLTSYGRFATIQNAQNQNALAQYQLAAAQRAEAQQNALYEQAQMPGFKLDFSNALRYGAPGIAAYKAQREAETQGLQAEELRGKIAAQPGVMAKTKAETDRFNQQVVEGQTKALGLGLMQALNNPDDNTLKSVFDRLDATGVDTKTYRDQFAAIPDITARKQIIEQYALSNPEGRQALEFVSPKPQTFNLGGKEVSIDMNPRSPTFKQELISREKTATPDALIADARLKEQHVDQLKQWDRLNDQQKAQLQELTRSHNLQDARSRAQLAETIANNARVDRREAQRISETIANNARVDRREAQKIAQPKFDAGAGGFVYAPTSENPQGKFVPVTGIDGKAPNEAQGNAIAYGVRMDGANKILEGLEGKGIVSGSRIKGAVAGALEALVPYQGEKLAAGAESVLRPLLSSEGQNNYEQAKENFITAVLRKESGASISPAEFAREERKYFPQFNDDASTIKQKQEARRLAISAIRQVAGPFAKNIDAISSGAAGGPSTGAATGSDPLGLRK